MGKVFWGNLTRWAILGSIALLLAPGSVRADDADTQKVILELKARMEAMEKQNQLLQQKLEQVQQQGKGGAEQSENQADDGKPRGDVSEDQVKKMIGDYMKEDAARKKLAEEEQKKADSEAYSEIVNNTPMSGVWDNGFMLTSKNRAFTARVGLEVQEDMVFMQSPFNVEYGKGGVGPVTDGVNTRRCRIDVRGQAWENFQYMCQWDFGLATATPNAVTNATTNGTSANLGNAFGTINGNVFNTPQPIEMWGMFTDLPLVRNIRIGNQKPLWSFENWNSSRFQNFMERSLAWDAFIEDQNNGFIPGIVMLNWTENERMTFQAGLMKNNRNVFFFNEQNGADMANARVSFLPWYCDNGRYLIHIGCGGMFADASNDIVRIRARTLLRNTNNQAEPILTEARMNAKNESRLVPEFYMNLGPFNLQAEYYMMWAGDASTISTNPTLAAPVRQIGTYFASGYYVQAGYYLTGEYNPYNKQLGRLERTIPNSNFFWTRGNGRSIFSSGCWWTGVRYSWVDLRDQGVNGASTTASGAQASSAGVWDTTYSLVWIVNPNTRIMFNAILENRNAATTPQSDGYIKGCGMRLQWDF